MTGGKEHTMRIIIGADHAGFQLKQTVVKVLREWGHEVEDVGTHTGDWSGVRIAAPRSGSSRRPGTSSRRRP